MCHSMLVYDFDPDHWKIDEPLGIESSVWGLDEKLLRHLELAVAYYLILSILYLYGPPLRPLKQSTPLPESFNVLGGRKDLIIDLG